MLAPSPGVLVIGSIGIGRSCLVKYLATNSYVPFITVFLNQYLLNIMDDYEEPDPFLTDSEDEDDGEVDVDLDVIDPINASDESESGLESNLDLIGMDVGLDGAMQDEILDVDDRDEYEEDIEYFHPFVLEEDYMSLEFALVRTMSPCIIWIPDIDYPWKYSEGIRLLVNYLSEGCSTSNTLVIASTHFPRRLDPILIGRKKFNTFIKMRRLNRAQQQKFFFTLSSTRGFHLEKQIQTKGFGSITLGSTNTRDLVALTNEALSISIAQKKSILDANTIRTALHRKTWDLRGWIKPLKDHGILFYQIGRAVAQKVLLSNWLVEPISIYMKQHLCEGEESYLYMWYFEIGTSLKKLTILLYLLSCSAGPVAEALWSVRGSYEKNEKNGMPPYRLRASDSRLVDGLLDVEGALGGSSRDCSPFDNDRVPLFLRPTPYDMMKNASRSIVDQDKAPDLRPRPKLRILLEEDQIADDLVEEYPLWSPRIWRPWGLLFKWIERPYDLGFADWTAEFPSRIEEEEYVKTDQDSIAREEFDPEYDAPVDVQLLGEDEDDDKYDKKDDEEEEEEDAEEDDEEDDKKDNEEDDEEDELQENDSEFWTRDSSVTEQSFLLINRFIWEPPDALFWLFQDHPPGSVFSHRDFFAHNELKKVLRSSRKKLPEQWTDLWFFPDLHANRFEFSINRQRWWLRTHSSGSNESFRSKTLSESYQYLSTLFLSNGTLLDQMTKTLLRKRWLFPDEMQI